MAGAPKTRVTHSVGPNIFLTLPFQTNSNALPYSPSRAFSYLQSLRIVVGILGRPKLQQSKNIFVFDGDHIFGKPRDACGSFSSSRARDALPVTA